MRACVNLTYKYYYAYFKVTFYATLDILNSKEPYDKLETYKTGF